MKMYNNKGGYSILIILLIIGFLLFLGVGVFNLVLNDMKDNKAMGDYIKAYAGAESAGELALLQIKKNGYAYYDKIDHDINDRSIVLAGDPLNKSNFKNSKDVFLSYDIGSKVNSYSGKLSPLSYDIIPLFYLDDSGEQKVGDLSFNIISGNEGDLSWNLIGQNGGLSGVGENIEGVKKILTADGFKYSNENINDFVSGSEQNYLVLFNSGNSGDISYSLSSDNHDKYFSKPRTTISASAQVGNYKQNLDIDLDNTEFLNMLKYSIFSN